MKSNLISNLICMDSTKHNIIYSKNVMNNIMNK